jgi:hypothetical protein
LNPATGLGHQKKIQKVMQKKINIQLVVKIALLLLLPALHHAQIVIGSGPANGSAQLELQSTDKGMLIPRLTTAQRDAIASPAMGLMIYNTSTHCLEINVGTASAPQWGLMNCRTGVIATLDCGNTVVTGTLSPGQAASGVSASVPYTGGNEGVHTGQTVASTGVTGFTATLSAGRFANGAGNLTYDITGTPASAGTATFALNIGGQACNLNVTVSYVCKAKINATTYRDFMCYNLGAASTSADPFTPSWEINGGYWQWGRSAEAAAGPTGRAPVIRTRAPSADGTLHFLPMAPGQMVPKRPMIPARPDTGCLPTHSGIM